MSAEVANREEVDITKAVLVRTKDGKLSGLKFSVPLSVSSGTLVSAGSAGIICSAEGYKVQAKYRGLIADFMPTVIVDGVEQGNPAPVRDKGGNIIMVYCRGVCFGRTSVGKRTVSTKTVVLHLDTYRNVDLIAKAQRCCNDFKFMPAGSPPASGWSVYHIDEATDIHANTTSGEFTKWMKATMNRKRKAVEYAQTFAVRGAIKAWPDITFHKCGSASAMVPCFMWHGDTEETQWDGSTYDMFIDAVSGVSGGKQGKDEIEVIDAGEEALHDEHDAVEAEGVDADDMDSEGGDAQDATPKQQVDDEDRIAHIGILKGIKKSHPNAYKHGAKDCGLKASDKPEDQSSAKLFGWSNLAADYAAQETE